MSPLYPPPIDTNFWTPADHGLIAWSIDPPLGTAGTVLGVAGTIYVQRLKVRAPALVTNIHLTLSAVGVTLTAGQCFAGLYQAGGLIGSSADQAAAWVSIATVNKTIPLVGGPFPIAAGDVYVGMFANGSTLPSFARAGTGVAPNDTNIASASSRFGTADTGRTTSLPGTLGTVTNSGANGIAYFAAIS